MPVGSTKSVNRFGVSDLAGNVREWTWNVSGRGTRRFILGGGWNDPDYAFVDAYAQPPFDRSADERLPLHPHLERRAQPRQRSHRAIDRPHQRLPSRRNPCPDAVFTQYLRQFAYDKTPLDAQDRRREADRRRGPRQKITFTAAYGGERMMAYLFLPPAGQPPYQVVVVFPGLRIDLRRARARRSTSAASTS